MNCTRGRLLSEGGRLVSAPNVRASAGTREAQLPARSANATTSCMASKLEGTPIEAAASRAAAPDRARRAVLRLIAASPATGAHASAVPRLHVEFGGLTVLKAARAPVRRMPL